MNGVTSGGLGNTYGGEGRFRFEAPIFPQGNPNAFPIANQNGQDSYRGVTIEYASQIKKKSRFSIGFFQWGFGSFLYEIQYRYMAAI